MNGPDGKPTRVRLWGVKFHKERRSIRTEAPWVVDELSGRKVRSESQQVDAPSLAQWGEEWERVSSPFYSVMIRLLGKYRHVGVAKLPNTAALLWDSALFHLWGFCKNPKPRFNFLRPGDEPPQCLDAVTAMREKLRKECVQYGYDFDAMNYTFFQRKEHKPRA